MNDIRFRSWDSQLGELVYWTRRADGYNKETFFNRAEIDQYTGVNDKNGLEIYEGDVLEVYMEGCKQDWGYLVDNLRDFYEALDTIDSYQRIEENKMKVIGNIYENPELLEEE